MANRMMKWFEFDDLSADLQAVVGPCADLAALIDATVPEGAEKTAGLRKLLEAKDCFVRAQIEARETKAGG
jgi:hypothetical protein